MGANYLDLVCNTYCIGQRKPLKTGKIPRSPITRAGGVFPLMFPCPGATRTPPRGPEEPFAVWFMAQFKQESRGRPDLDLTWWPDPFSSAYSCPAQQHRRSYPLPLYHDRIESSIVVLVHSGATRHPGAPRSDVDRTSRRAL